MKYSKCWFLLVFVMMAPFMVTAQSNNDQLEDILNVLKIQEKAWNDGDLETFMNYYAVEDSISFTGSRGISYGWQTISDNYKRGYPNKTAMGRLAFDILHSRPLGGDHYMILGRFTLYREADQPTGYFSLIFEKQNGQWKIIADHTSSS